MAVTVPTAHRFTVAEWEQLGRLGVFGDARMELLDGEIVDMTPIGDRHLACVHRLSHALVAGTGDGAAVRVQLPLVLDDYSAPVPDLALLRPAAHVATDTRPRAGDVLLVVEIADSSLAYDLDRKAPRYAAAGVGECWVVDLEAEEVLVLTEPRPGGYAAQASAGTGDTLRPVALPDVAVAAATALGRG